VARSDFTEAEAVYQGFVDKMNTANANYDRANDNLTTAQQDKKNVEAKIEAANRSLNAAAEMNAASTSRPLHFQVGANGGQSLYMSIGSLKSDTLGIGDGKGHSFVDVVEDTGSSITATIDVLDQALSYVTTERSKLGAAVNRMEYTQQSLDITSENLTDAEARIRDADMAQEMMNKTKADTLQQVAVAMMSQANQQPQSILQLLR
jgi:flagellin